MPDPVGGREAVIEAALDRIDWYRRCLEDIQDGRPVHGLLEAKLGYDSAMDELRVRSSGSAAQNHWRDLYWETLAEVERLREKVGQTQVLLGATASERDRKTARAVAAEAEVERLRNELPAQDQEDELRERIADELARNDECGPGPVSRQEYLDDAEVILSMIRTYGGTQAARSSGSAAQNQEEALRRFGQEHGIAALLDHLGLDEFGNEVSRLYELARSPQDEDNEDKLHVR